ncbi:MAG: mandelate racemase [Pseudomonadota bacterium]|nr:mandelate racemase [Pseudomonadota bacterium]
MPARQSIRRAAAPSNQARLTGLSAHAYRIPTSSPEADGTIDWDSTTLVAVHAEAAGQRGFGYSYASRAAVEVIKDTMKEALAGMDALDTPACWQAMRRAVRNMGRPGIAATAISAVDNALWDLKGKIFGQPLIALLGAARARIPVYGSGGFTTYGPKQIQEQIEGWKAQGIWQFKIKIGRDERQDRRRIAAAVEALPEDGKLFVDANGAYHPREALQMAHFMADNPIAWFEEPVSSDDIPGLAFLRRHAPPAIAIAAGEYSYDLDDSRQLLEAEAVDVLQIDATRCLGITGFLKATALAEAYHRPISAHCAPSIHAALCCHAIDATHVEYFWDHARIEQKLFDGAPQVKDGCLTPTDAPGLGLTFKEKDAERFAV